VVATNERYFAVNENGVLTGFTGPQTNVVIPSVVRGVTIVEIGEGAFHNRGLTNVTIPNGVRRIGRTSDNIGAFSNNRLTSIVIPDSVRIIASRWPTSAFGNNNITSVTIGTDVDITGMGISGFEDSFRQNGRRAGTYTRSGNTWAFTAR